MGRASGKIEDRNINIPILFDRSRYMKALMLHSGEPSYVCYGRFLEFLFSVAVQKRRVFTMREVNEMVSWTRFDISYSEVLLKSYMGEIDDKKGLFRFIQPYEICLGYSRNGVSEAAKRRAKTIVRDEKGRIVSSK